LPDLIAPLRELLARNETALARRERGEELAELRWWLALDAGHPEEARQRLRETGQRIADYRIILAEIFWGGLRTVSSRDMARMTDELGICALGLLHAHEGRWDAVAEAVAGLASFDGSTVNHLVRQQGRVCMRILEARHAQATASPLAHRLILSVDSLLLTVPYVQLDWENLMVARLLEGEGEYARAAAAASRFRYGLGYPMYMATYLRDGGRMAMLAGDRERAVARFSRYLALRSEPEPATTSEVAEVRSTLDSLIVNHD
jgi:hypothetical protein